MVDAQSSGWLTDYPCRRALVLSAVDGGTTDVSIQLNIKYQGTGLSTNGHAKPDFSDLAFTAQDGYTPLNFWIQAYTPSTAATVWVKVSADISSAQTIYMYYGNSSVPSLSNIAGTFLIADDFANGSIGSSWTWVNEPSVPASYTVDRSCLKINSGGQDVDIWGTTDTAYQLLQDAPAGNFETIMKLSCMPSANSHDTGLIVKQDSQNWVRASFQYVEGCVPGTITDIIYNENGLSTANGFTMVKPIQYIALKCVNNIFSMKYSAVSTAWNDYVGGTHTQVLINPKIGLYLKTANSTDFSASYDWIVTRKVPASDSEPNVTALAEETNVTFTVSAWAESGGSITPTSNFYSMGAEQNFTVTANPQCNISGVSLDSNILTNGFNFTQKSPVGTSDYNAKVAIVDGERYIITNNWTATKIVSPAQIKIWAADLNWDAKNLVSTSPNKALDIYVPNFTLPHSILIVGRTSTFSDVGFVAAYNLTTNTWTWANQPNVGYITNVFNPTGNILLLQVAVNSSVCFYKTTVNHLFSPASWTSVDFPSWNAGVNKEARIAYFKGMVYMLQSSVSYVNDFGFALGRYNLTSSCWEESPLLSFPDPAKVQVGVYVFGYVWADQYILLCTTPMSDGTYNVYYSTDGTTLNLAFNIPSPTGYFSSFESTEFHCWAEDYKKQGSYILLSNTVDDMTNGYMALMTLNGDVLAKGSGYSSHNTELVHIYDGNCIVEGAEIAQVGLALDYPANLKLVCLTSSIASPYTFTLKNIVSDHSIVAYFKRPIVSTSATSNASLTSDQQPADETGQTTSDQDSPAPKPTWMPPSVNQTVSVDLHQQNNSELITVVATTVIVATVSASLIKLAHAKKRLKNNI